jgi:maleylpyruvate isomerase
MKLYSYFRSSASYRVRIALNVKNLPYEYAPVHLVREGGEQLKPAYRQINEDGIVPTLVDDEQHLIQQSLAIIEYLEETHPEPPLLPKTPADRAHVRSLALQVACEIHPVDNLRVLKYLKHTLGIDDAAKDAWYRHWIELGFGTLEQRLASDARTGKLCHGDTPTIADTCLIPQVFNANRFKIDTTRYPTIQRIYDHAMQIDAFAKAAPGEQPDSE